VKKKPRRGLDCECGGVPSLCPPCLVRFAATWRRAHPFTLSVAMVKRRLPGIGDREAALLVEVSKRFA
jgi:hypothetical protein